MLGPVLLNDLVNDLNKGVHTKIPKSVDDTQLFAVVQCSTNSKQLQEDLMWAKKLSIKFKAGAKWCKKIKIKTSKAYLHDAELQFIREDILESSLIGH